LSKKMWHPTDIPAVWFAMWMERLTDALMEKWIKIRDKDSIDLYFIQLWDEAKKIVLSLTLKAREAWINTLSSLGTPSLKIQMKKANRIKAKYVVMVWVMEARNGLFQVRDMEAWTQEEVKKDELIAYIIEKIGKDRLDFYSPAKDMLRDDSIHISDKVWE
jgi:histidyl-tRNA synthetase